MNLYYLGQLWNDGQWFKTYAEQEIVNSPMGIFL